MVKHGKIGKYFIILAVLVAALVIADLLAVLGGVRTPVATAPASPAPTAAHSSPLPVPPIPPPSVAISPTSTAPVVPPVSGNPAAVSSTAPVAPPPVATSSAPTLTSSSYALTVPSETAPLHPSSNAALETFDVSVTQSGYSPSFIVVRQGDGVALKIAAVDGAYDLFFPALNFGSGQIPKGETATMSFIPSQTGKYVFECRVYCPEGDRITGQVVVLPQ